MRTKKTLLIFLTDVIPLIAISIIGIFKLKLFIQILGTETLGLYQLFAQIMIYIALVDGGLTTAVLHSLYKPNAKDDKEKVVAILVAAKRLFSLIGVIVFGVATIFASFTPYLIKNSTLDNNFIIVAFFLFSLSNVIGYFFVPYQLFLEVREKKHLSNLPIAIGQIIQGLLEIGMLLSGFSFMAILFMHTIIKLASNLVLIVLHKKYYKGYEVIKSKPNYEFTKQVKHLIVHKINGLIGSNIDIIIISKFLGLQSVAVYSAYNYIINMLQQIFGKFSSSLLALLGNFLAVDDNKSYDLFKELNNLMFFIAIIICVPMLFAFNYFINIWYEGVVIANSIVALSFVAMLFIFIVKQPTVTYVNAAGLFKETKFCAITDSAINLVLSLFLVQYFGISGVLIATVIAVIISEYFLKTTVVYDKVFKKSAIIYHKTNLKFIFLTIFDVIIGFFIFKNLIITSIFKWFFIFTLYTALNSLVVFLMFKIFKATDFTDRLNLIIKRGKI